jgi:hypothetical protein
MGFKVAVVGATGNVGREMLNILAERRFPADEVVALASRKSMGVEVSFGDKTLKCKTLDHYDFSDVDICLMSAGGEVSKEWSPKIGAQGAVVIDNSSAWRMDPDVPLIVPEVNADAAAGRHQADVDIGEIGVLQRLALQRLVAERDLDTLAPSRRDRDHLVGREASLLQDVEHLAAHIAGGAHDRDLETHGKLQNG